MAKLLFHKLLFLLPILVVSAQAQSNSGDGYIGYLLQRDGDQGSAVYETDDTPSQASPKTLPPDVHLNASVHVGEIDIEVQNLTAKINLDAQVLQLLQFNAGVEASVDRVQLNIRNVTAKVLLEARLQNLVIMIDDVLNSLDLNPVLATLGEDVGKVVNATVGGLPGSNDSHLTSRGLDYDLVHNILYSINDYSGNTHTNRILSQNGDIIEQKLHNNGQVYHSDVVGSYLRDMTFNGHNVTAVVNGQPEYEAEYVYQPFIGLSVVCAIFTDTNGKVVRAQVLSESGVGGTSTIDGEI